MSYKMNKALTVIAILAVIALAFFVTSLCLANAHGNTLVAEWQSWFGIAKKVADNIKDPAQEEVTTNAIKTLFKF